MEIPNPILKTIYQYYPQGINYYATAHHDAPETKHLSQLLNQIEQSGFAEWNHFKEVIDTLGISYLDDTFIPQYNTCYRMKIRHGVVDGMHCYITYYISVIYPAFCFVTHLSKDGRTVSINWNDVPEQRIAIHQKVVDCIFNFLKISELLDKSILGETVPNVNVDKQLGQDKVFSFIFMNDPIYGKTL